MNVGKQKIKLPYLIVDWEGCIRRSLQSEKEIYRPVRRNKDNQEKGKTVKGYQSHEIGNINSQKT